MKTTKELKQEQYDLKAKLHEVIEFTNSDGYFKLSPREKGLIGQQRAGMEMYLNALTNRIYSKDECSFDATSLMGAMLLGNIWSGFSSSSPSSKASEDLQKMIDEEKELKKPVEVEAKPIKKSKEKKS